MSVPCDSAVTVVGEEVDWDRVVGVIRGFVESEVQDGEAVVRFS